ncbi:SHOCT domain-containing protein [Streptomyces sp. NPDC059851]|uniref:SHOCT domain-containing protein n=1 Tax=Streptomyces sp. NPDC059851 TaxID=3346971 RepID=UPI00365A0489
MFIRPVGPVVHPARRPAGRPLLRGILARGAYVWDVAHVPPRLPQHDTGAPAPPPGPVQAPVAGGAVEGEAAGEPVWESAGGPAGESAWEPAGTAARSAPGGEPGPTAEPPGVEAGGDLTTHLTQLAALAREGLLTPEEFSAAKARLLNP